jgi:hypothetical protein
MFKLNYKIKNRNDYIGVIFTNSTEINKMIGTYYWKVIEYIKEEDRYLTTNASGDLKSLNEAGIDEDVYTTSEINKLVNNGEWVIYSK